MELLDAFKLSAKWKYTRVIKKSNYVDLKEIKMLDLLYLHGGPLVTWQKCIAIISIN